MRLRRRSLLILELGGKRGEGGSELGERERLEESKMGFSF